MKRFLLPVVLLAGVSVAPAGAQTGATWFAEAADDDRVRSADYDWVLRTRDGRETTLSEYRGRVLFVNLWATWCVPCRVELASIQRLARSLPDGAVTFLLISPESPAPVEAFARRADLELPVLTEVTRAPRAWGVEAVPTTWLVDANGRIVLQRRGAAEWDDQAVRDYLLWLAGSADR